ncbi:hypothetical protein ACSBR2_040473 [Camellia fascicularis]
MNLSDGGVRLELMQTTTSPLAIDVSETAETRIRRLISENPVIIFSKSSCYMCHVMRLLLSGIGVHPTVIELDDDDEISAVPSDDDDDGGGAAAPALFIGGTRVGGLERLNALHVSGHLVPKLVEVGALSGLVL